MSDLVLVWRRQRQHRPEIRCHRCRGGGEEVGEREEVTENERKRRNEHGSRKTLLGSVRLEPRENVFFHPQGQAGEEENEIKHDFLLPREQGFAHAHVLRPR